MNTELSKLLSSTAQMQYSHEPDGFNHVKYNCCQWPAYPAAHEIPGDASELYNYMAVLWDDRELNESIAAGDWKIVKLYSKQDKQLTGYNTHWDYDDNDYAETERERKLAKWRNEDLDPYVDEPWYMDPDDYYEQQMDAIDDWQDEDTWEDWAEDEYSYAFLDQAYEYLLDEITYDLEDQLIASCARKRSTVFNNKRNNLIDWIHAGNKLSKKWKNSKAKHGKNKCKGNHRKYRKPDDAVWYKLMEDNNSKSW